MGIKERLLSIRLMEKLQSHPEYAKALGIEVCQLAPPGARKKEEER